MASHQLLMHAAVNSGHPHGGAGPVAWALIMVLFVLPLWFMFLSENDEPTDRAQLTDEYFKNQGRRELISIAVVIGIGIALAIVIVSLGI